MNGRLVNNILLLTLPVVLVASLVVVSPGALQAHAQSTGLVCITDNATATGCPASPPTIGSLEIGSSFTVGVFVENSDPLGGWDMYVAVDPAVLNPTSAALGNLVANPSLTSICINGVATTGSCTLNTANGAGVVEATTIDSSGENDCNNPSPPCSGLAFTINYVVVGPAPNASIFYPSATGCSNTSVTGTETCVLIADNFGTPLPETIQGATVTQHVVPTNTSLNCSPSTLLLGLSTSCTATVTTTGPTSPNGTVTFSTDRQGDFNPSSICGLSTEGNQTQCSISYHPAEYGTHNIGAVYNGDAHHLPSTAPTSPLNVTFAPGDFLLTAAATSFSIPSGGIGSDNLTVAGLGNFTGSITFTTTLVPFGVNVIFVPNPATISTVGGTTTSEMTIFINSLVTPGTAFTFQVIGSAGPNGTLTHRVTISVTVNASGLPTLVQGKIRWIHHFSLTKENATQTFTAIVANPMSNSVNVVIRIVGASSVNPSLFFDYSCGVTCRNTGPDGVSSTPGLTPCVVAAGDKSFSFSFNTPIDSGFTNQNVSFTATLYWAQGTQYISSNSKSGSFAVVP